MSEYVKLSEHWLAVALEAVNRSDTAMALRYAQVYATLATVPVEKPVYTGRDPL